MTKVQVSRSLIDSIKGLLLQKDEVNLNDMRDLIPVEDGTTDLQMKHAVWAAREEVRKENSIDFAPVRGKGGHIHRAAPGQIVKRSHRGRRAGLKKLDRAVHRMDIASTKVPLEQQAQVEKMLAQQRLQVTAAKTRRRRLEDAMSSDPGSTQRARKRA